MDNASFIKARVSLDTKQRVQIAAQRALLTESIWLRQAIDLALTQSKTQTENPPPATQLRLSTRVSVRLRFDDRALLHERALARGMPSGTYLSVLTRAHLHNLAPLPKAELLALKRCTAELSTIGRNLNQIARAANSGGPGQVRRDELHKLLSVCQGLRDHVKSLLRTNLKSWEDGHGESRD